MTGWRRILALALLAAVFIMEGYDINAMALAVPRIEPELGLAASSFGLVFTALLVGIGIGGAFIAPLGDRIGRRPLIVFGCLAVAVCTLMTAAAASIAGFLVLRLLTGIAFGACLPNVSALSAELAPDRLRATIMAIVSAGIPLGLAFAGIFAPQVVAVAGWQGLFVVPGLIAAALALGLGYLLAAGPPGETHDEPTEKPKLPQLELFKAPWLFPFAVFALLLSINALNLYYLNSWLPSVLPLAGFSLDEAARLSGVVQLAGIAIGIAASVGIDRWRPSLTLILMFGAMAASFAAIAVGANDTERWTYLLMLGVGGASAGAMALPALCAYLFGPQQLSSAIGLGILVARVAAFFGPLIGQWVLGAQASAQTFFLVAAVPAALCVLACLALPAALQVRKRLDAAAA
jgi:AAHS family 4-hydroxybenzoate transporter-like MFS transporter